MLTTAGMGELEVDFVVIGGGSAGCVAAGELAAGGHSVLLLESGDRAEDNPETLRADGYKEAFVNDRLMWERFTVPQPGCAGRRIYVGSGRGMGGSGAVNAMVYTRGAREDYDDWGDDWRWRDVVPHFEALERKLRINRRAPTAFTETCIAAAEDAGFRRKDDLNDGDLSGVLGYEWMSYDGEQRRSSYVAFIAESPRDNLRVLTGATVRRIVIEGRRATGVVFGERDRPERHVAVRREIVLCAGALESPKLLMLSGIGPGAELRRLGIDVALDAPSIGANLHDHPNVTLFFLGHRAVDCNHPQLYGFHRAKADASLAPGQSDSCYVFYPARSSFREGMLRLLPGIALPQRLYEVPALPRLMRRAIGAAFDVGAVQRFVARMYGIVVILGKPKSRGSVRLASADPAAPALVDPAYFDAPDDMDTMLHGVKLARSIAQQRALTGWGNRELLPGGFTTSESSVARFVRNNAMTTFHYAGTCGIGRAVSRQLALHGIDGLRVADASVTPFTPVSAMNAPSMMVGLRAAQFAQAAIR
jgi:choline dehydrogenase